MTTQKIVLALALAAVVTPAVVSAQENVYVGPGSKMLYISDNALARIRGNYKEQQNPVKQPQNQTQTPQQQTVEPKPQATTQANREGVYSYAYTGREGHMAALGFLFTKPRNNRQDRSETKPTTNNTPNVTRQSNNTYNPYVGPEGHRMATGNYVKDAKKDTTPNYVRDIDTISRNHQVTLDTKTADRNSRRTNNGVRQILREVSQAIAQEAPYMK